MGKVTKSVEISASPEAVFNFFIDFSQMNNLHAGFTKGQLTSNEPFGVGTTAHFISGHGGNHFEWDSKITELIKNEKITWESMDPGDPTNIYTFQPSSNGTLLTHTAQYELPYSLFGKLIDKLKVEKDVDKEITIELETAKKALEKQVLIKY